MSMSYKLLLNQLVEQASSAPKLTLSTNELIECLDTILGENPDEETKIGYVISNMTRAIEFRDHEDRLIRNKARSLLEGSPDNLNQIYGKAKQFEKELERTGDTVLIDLIGNYQLEEVESRLRIESLGNTFSNCLRDTEQVNDYLDQIRKDEIRMYLLLKDEKPFALFTINTEDNEINEFEGRRGDNVSISFKLAIDILNKLETRANSTTEFVRVGAYDKFKSDQPLVPATISGSKKIWVWRYECEIIIAVEEYSDGKLLWSRFVQENRVSSRNRRSTFFRYSNDGHWCSEDENYLKAGDLIQLVIENPQLVDKLSGPIIEEN